MQSSPVHPYAERLAPLDFARGKLSEAEGSRDAAPMTAVALLGEDSRTPKGFPTIPQVASNCPWKPQDPTGEPVT